jgi:hypothetical protein
MKKLAVMIVAAVVGLFSCERDNYSDYDLPGNCDGKCEFVSDMNSFRDAVANSAAQFSNCICLEKGLIEGEITVSKTLNIIGRKDRTSMLKNISFFNAQNVLVSDITFQNISVNDSAMFISGSSVKLENVVFSNIRAASLFGGRAVVISGERSDVSFENVRIEKTDGTGLLIDGSHEISVISSNFSDCGFAGIWVQNSRETSGMLKVSDTVLNDNGAVSLQILGKTALAVSDSQINGVKKREINMEVVGDGIVVKNRMMTKEGSVSIKNLKVTGFERAGMIFDGDSDSILNGIVLENISITSENGQFGAVVQNGKEPSEFRNGIDQNEFTQNDKNLTSPLYLIETIQEM